MSEDKVVAVGTDGRRLAKNGRPRQSGQRSSNHRIQCDRADSSLAIDRPSNGDEGEVKIAVRGNDILIKPTSSRSYTRMVEGRVSSLA